MKTEGMFQENVKKPWQLFSSNKNSHQSFSSNSSQLFEVTEVCPGLLLCGATMVGRTNHPITCIVNAAPELPDPPLPDTIKTVKIHIRDSATEPLDSYFDQVADLVQKVRDEGGCTLIHCVAGVSRSASLCLAYLIKYNQMTFLQAFHYLRSLRPCIRPNLGFFKQLIEFEKRFYPESSVEIVYCDAAQTYIPSVYEEEYKNMVTYQRYCGHH
ncbi:hypothetical protein WDU94_012518 [Cyamophila willieti]